MSGPYGLIRRGPDGKDVYGHESLDFKTARQRHKDKTDPAVVGVYLRQGDEKKVVFHESEKEESK